MHPGRSGKWIGSENYSYLKDVITSENSLFGDILPSDKQLWKSEFAALESSATEIQTLASQHQLC